MANNQFNLTLDTLAPSGSIECPREYTNTDRNFTINYNTDAAYMRFWWDTDQSPASAPAESAVPWTAAVEGTVQSNIWDRYSIPETNYDPDNIYYGHIQFKDSVGNISSIFSSGRFVYDNHRPDVPSLSVLRSDNKTVAKAGDTLDITIVGIKDNGPAGLDKIDVTFSGAGWSETVTKSLLSTSAGVTLSNDGSYTYTFIKTVPTNTTNGTLTVTAKVYDLAGNTSSATNTWISIDNTKATFTLSLREDKPDGQNLTYTNSLNFKALLDIDNTFRDVVGYKLWGDFQASNGSGPISESSATWVTVQKGTDPITKTGLKFTSSQGVKTIYAKVIDEAGNISEQVSASINAYDSVKPECTLAFSNSLSTSAVYVESKSNWYMAASQHSTITVESTWKDTNMDTYAQNSEAVKIFINDTLIDRATNNGSTDIYKGTISNNDGIFRAKFVLNTLNFHEGSNTVCLKVTDKAGNTTTMEKFVYYDTIAPSVAEGEHIIGLPASGWCNRSFNIATPHFLDSGAGLKDIVVWSSTVENQTEIPGNALALRRTISGSNTAASLDTSAIHFSLVPGDINYLHIAVRDQVDNILYFHSGAFGYDATAPNISSIYFEKDHYNTQSATVRVLFNDSNGTSTTCAQVSSFYITSGDITSSLSGWQNITASQRAAGYFDWSVTLTGDVNSSTGRKNKSITIKVKDFAGNESTTATATTCYDNTKPSAQIHLLHPTSNETKSPSSPDPKFRARILFTGSEDGEMKYQMYGDFTHGSTQQAAGITYAPNDNTKWLTFTPDSGRTDKLISSLIATSGGGTKTIYVRFMDAAGNISDPASAQFNLDTSRPEPTILGDFNRVSCVHTLRDTSATSTSENKYNDMVTLTITPSKQIQAYKIVAYNTIAEATSGNHSTKAAIGTTYGSVNMSATGLDTSATIQSILMGKDYHQALGGTFNANGTINNRVDGAHVLVVYVQDTGGTWSGAVVTDIEYSLYDNANSSLVDSDYSPLTSVGP